VKKNEKETAAHKLLERVANEEYLAECASLLQKEKHAEEIITEHSVVIFRLGSEWLALSTLIFAEVTDKKSIHRIPHKSDGLLLGVVNLRGQLQLCISLPNILQIINGKKIVEEKKEGRMKMIAIKKGNDRWIFPVDEVYGINRFNISELKNVPVTVTKSSANFLKAIIPWEDKNVGYIDEELLFMSLNRSIA
jgi:chemotaxis-related protein WspD